MALFKLRKKVDEPVAKPPAESIEAVRRRARHRLIGAVVLVVLAVVGFPLLFDTQPRPVSVDIPIEIPDRNKVKPLPPAPQAAVAPKAVVPPAPTAAVAENTKPMAPASSAIKPAPAEKVAKAEPAEKKPEPKPEPRAEARPEPKAEAKPPAKAEPKVASDDAAKARALLEGQSIDTAAAGLRYVVQVGAFAEKDKALLAQRKLERAGLKNYTNIADTKDGKRIRVRAGPFASRDEAARAAEKIKGLDLPAAILSL